MMMDKIVGGRERRIGYWGGEMATERHRCNEIKLMLRGREREAKLVKVRQQCLPGEGVPCNRESMIALIVPSNCRAASNPSWCCHPHLTL